MDVTVVEARDRVGERVHSVELDNGEIAELGAEWILDEDEALRATIDRRRAGRVRGARGLPAPGAARYHRGPHPSTGTGV